MESYCYCLSPWGNYYVRTLHIYTNIYYIGVFLYEQDRLLHKQGILEEFDVCVIMPSLQSSMHLLAIQGQS